MARHVVARASESPPGARKLVRLNGRGVVVFNVKGEFFALSDRCPHKGASLSGSKMTGLVESGGPGDYTYTRVGEIVRCPWHGWEFDLQTGLCLDEPSLRTAIYQVRVEGDRVLIQA